MTTKFYPNFITLLKMISEEEEKCNEYIKKIEVAINKNNKNIPNDDVTLNLDQTSFSWFNDYKRVKAPSLAIPSLAIPSPTQPLFTIQKYNAYKSVQLLPIESTSKDDVFVKPNKNVNASMWYDGLNDLDELQIEEVD